MRLFLGEGGDDSIDGTGVGVVGISGHSFGRDECELIYFLIPHPKLSDCIFKIINQA